MNDVTFENPTFTAPTTTTQIDLSFNLIVTKEEGTASEPDEVTITVSPISTSPPPTQEPKSINDIIKDLVKNPSDITNSIELSMEIIDVLTDSDRNNDQIVCDLLADIKGKQMNGILEIINC